MGYNKYAAKNLTPYAKFSILNSIETKDIVTAYVDGSFKDKQNNGYGVILKHKDLIIHEESNLVSIVDAEPTNMTSIKAELISSLRAIDVGRILRTFKIKKNVEVTDNGKIII